MGHLQAALMDDTMSAVYGWLLSKSDDDGFVDAACGNLALALGKPLRTVQGAIARLEARGLIVMIAKGKVVITDGKIDTINGCPIEAGTIASQKAVAKAVAEFRGEK
jgi:hypothetical protein